LISDKLSEGKFDTEFLSTKQKNDLEPSDAEALEKTDEDESLDMVTVSVCASIVVIGAAGLYAYMRR